METTTLARRDLVKAAGAVAAGLATAAVVREANAQGSAPAPEAWDRETDVLVIGMGHAGICAATEAQDAGANVLIVEKAPEETAGGASACYGGFLTLREGAHDPEVCYRYWSGRYPVDVLKARTDGLGLIAEWLEQNPVDGLEEYGQSGPYMQLQNPQGGWHTYAGCKQAVVDRGIEVLYNAPAVQLVQDQESGDVLGAIVDVDGQPTTVKANRGVILATGSYTGSPELVKQFGYAGIYIPNYDNPANTGDGIFLATAAGADLWGFSAECMCFQDVALTEASKEAGTGVAYQKPSADVATHIYVNREGKRFMNEMLNTRHYRGHLPFLDWDPSAEDYKNSPFWMVFGEDYLNNVRLGQYGTELTIDPNFGTPVLFSYNGVYGGYLWSMDNSEELERGWIISADTLEELAAKMVAITGFGDEVTCDAAGLAATVEEYNAMVAAGEDTAFGRPADYLKPVDTTGKFYAVELSPAVMYANGGPRVDVENRVLTPAGEPIGRLYAVGQLSGPSFEGRSSAPNAMITGVQAGRAAAALEPQA